MVRSLLSAEVFIGDDHLTNRSTHLIGCSQYVVSLSPLGHRAFEHQICANRDSPPHLHFGECLPTKF
ncbi:unnamed protein product [Calypogeia fissa]